MRIGHLTDLHLNGSAERAGRLARALETARAWRCDHLCITGDLTARGDDASFAQLGQLLTDSGWPVWAVTVVPGNHDVRADRRSWAQTMAATPSLQQHAHWSTPGQLRPHPPRRGVYTSFLALDTTAQGQALALRARGQLGMRGRWDLGEAGKDCADHDPRFGQLPLVVCMHHGPYESPLHPLDGLRDRAEVLEVLRRDCPTATVLCGHDHRALDLWPDEAGRARILVAPAVVDTEDPLRVYQVDARSKRLVSVKACSAGRYLRLEA